MDREAAIARIVAVLKPHLGATMAEAATKIHCDKLGLVGSLLSPEQLEALLARLATGLAVFVGREKTAQVVEPSTPRTPRADPGASSRSASSDSSSASSS
jgi:hypothetical protein